MEVYWVMVYTVSSSYLCENISIVYFVCEVQRNYWQAWHRAVDTHFAELSLYASLSYHLHNHYG